MQKSRLLLLCALLLVFTAFDAAVGQESKKTAYALLLDNTLSLKKQFPQVLRLGKVIITKAHKSGPIALFNFKLNHDTEFFHIHESNDQFEGLSYERASGILGVDSTQDEEALIRYVETLTVAKGNTNLFAAIHSTAEALDARVNVEKHAVKNKIIIIVTDGDHRMESSGGSPDDEDYRRKKSEQQLIRKLKESGIRILAVGLLQDLNSNSGRYRLTTRERAESFLKKITKETGGRVVFPRSKQFDVDAVVTELLNQ